LTGNLGERLRRSPVEEPWGVFHLSSLDGPGRKMLLTTSGYSTVFESV